MLPVCLLFPVLVCHSNSVRPHINGSSHSAQSILPLYVCIMWISAALITSKDLVPQRSLLCSCNTHRLFRWLATSDHDDDEFYSLLGARGDS